jgi:hypothetical protein
LPNYSVTYAPADESNAQGERESGTSRLQEAVAAYRAALEEWTVDAASHWHEIAQQNLAPRLASLERRRKQ